MRSTCERVRQNKIMQCLSEVLGEEALVFSKNDGKPAKRFEQRSDVPLCLIKKHWLLVGEWTLVDKRKEKTPIRSLLETHSGEMGRGPACGGSRKRTDLRGN